MFGEILKKIVGSKNERELKRIQPLVYQINEWEQKASPLTDDRLRLKTSEFKERIEKGESLDQVLPEAFAVVRETAKRTLGERHYDVQLIGGIVLHEGTIAEMATGEGKTLVSTLPAYLNALKGGGVHIVTVNDYLAKRDSEWMGAIYRFLGLSVGVILHELNDKERKIAYGCDITYGTNNEFGFDYLRDNMKFDIEDYVQRELNYAIVDEVDSILVDEARTPLIISGPAEESTDKYYKINRVIPFLKQGKDFQIEEKSHTAFLSEEGVAHVEKLINVENLYDPRNIETLHHVNQALRAHTLFKRDVDYVVKEGQVIIVDEFTGRLMPGRRWSDGLHQAVEAKENVRIENENQTLATITFQNYFRMYKKLAGMTGTADTEAAEFKKTYHLDVVVIPTNMPLIRTNYPDVIYKTEDEKFRAAVREIEELHRAGRPVLVGTISIEKSERLSHLLKKKGIPHNVLNAKHHEREAEIIAQAGRVGAVTISTNMAGRGTDILLGGNPKFLARTMMSGEETDPEAIQNTYQKAYGKALEIVQKEKEKVVQVGGLHVLGTERHEARRIDNQLRGRAGRQGDPGSSRFYLSLADDLLRIFGSERISSIMDRFGIEEEQPIEHKLVTRAIENAQRRVEAHNFEIRKHLLEYDNVMNQQREVIYSQRREVLTGQDLKDSVKEMIEEQAEGIVDLFADEKIHPEDWDLKGLQDAAYEQFAFHWMPPSVEQDGLNRERLKELVGEKAKQVYEKKEEEFGTPMLRYLEKVIMLQSLDHHWKDHLLAVDQLKEGIGLRGYGQKNPLFEYQKEAYQMFLEMLDRIKKDTIQKLFAIQIAKEQEAKELKVERKQTFVMSRGAAVQAGGQTESGKGVTVRREGKKVGRNDPCPCGSGKKYKKCCLPKEEEVRA
ncbi:MAG: preprotein translocase subunit SecA [Deltaproteobacteria bacterium RBG_16_48_10]|nr:MAG: preprotein translocase subunit SecA [Deltaproteobacteria bacterium RBG_16_48_10]